MAICRTICFILIICQPLSAFAQVVSENVKLNFATVMIPSTGSETLTISTTGTVSGNATVISGTPLNGEYLISKGTGPNRSISIDIQEGTSISGITLQNFTATYNGNTITLPATGLAAPGGSGKILKVGVSAVISSTISENSYSPALDLIIIKE